MQEEPLVPRMEVHRMYGMKPDGTVGVCLHSLPQHGQQLPGVPNRDTVDWALHQHWRGCLGATLEC